MNSLSYSVTPEKDKVDLGLNLSFDCNRELVDNANLGKTHQTCKVCDESGEFQTWLARENWWGRGDEFRYFECAHCGTLQIESYPANIEDYYGGGYYSNAKPEIKPANPGARRDVRKILDVGCGAGSWLCFLASIGCVNLCGCDTFIKEDLEYDNGVKIYKKSIHEMDGRYDVIHFGNSFEHMPDPKEVFASLNRLLKPKGRGILEEPKIEMTLPIFPNMAFDVFGPYWYCVDAPRHYFIYSIKGLTSLAEENGFAVADLKLFDYGTSYSFSRLYQLGIPFVRAHAAIASGQYFSAEELALFDLAAKASVATKRADIASFTFKRM